MAEYAVMPKADYQDACDAIREKTGGTESIKSGAMAGLIRGISSGGAPFKIGTVTLASGATSFSVLDVGTEYNRFMMVAFGCNEYFPLDTLSGKKYRLAWSNCRINWTADYFYEAIDLVYDAEYAEVGFESLLKRVNTYADPFTFGEDGSVSGTIKERKTEFASGVYIWIAWAE